MTRLRATTSAMETDAAKVSVRARLHSAARAHQNTGKGKAKEKLGKMGPPVDKAWLEKWRIKLKIAAVSIIASALFPCDR